MGQDHFHGGLSLPLVQFSGGRSSARLISTLERRELKYGTPGRARNVFAMRDLLDPIGNQGDHIVYICAASEAIFRYGSAYGQIGFKNY